MSYIPICVEKFADNGAHSHWSLLDAENGETIIENLSGMIDQIKSKICPLTGEENPVCDPCLMKQACYARMD